MTRLALLADVHGNLPALEAVLACIETQKVDQVVIAGDLINWGPFSIEVLQRVSGHGWAIIRGNNEYYLLEQGTPRMPAYWRHYELLPWLNGPLQGQWRRTIACWPDELSLRFADAPPLRVVHGAPGNPWCSLHPLLPEAELKALLTDVAETTVVAAHSHLPLDRRAGRWQLVNPGTVGVPLDGEPGFAHYARCSMAARPAGASGSSASPMIRRRYSPNSCASASSRISAYRRSWSSRSFVRRACSSVPSIAGVARIARMRRSTPQPWRASAK